LEGKLGFVRNSVMHRMARRDSVQEEEFVQRWKMTCGLGLSAGVRERGEYRFVRCWAAGWISGWAKKLPAACLVFFLFFAFSFSDF
jgi:hypothetical protein